MNRPRDDEYGSLHDLLGDSPYDDPGEDYSGTGDDPAGEPGSGDDTTGDSAEDPAVDTSREPIDDLAADPADSDLWRGLPAGIQAEYAEAFRRGYERARRGEDLAEQSGEDLAEQSGEDLAEQSGEEPTQEIRLPERAAPGPQTEAQQVAPGAQTEAELDHAEPEQQPTEPEWAEPWEAEPEQPVPEPDEPTRRIDRSALAGIGQPAATPPGPTPTGPRPAGPPSSSPPPGPLGDPEPQDVEASQEPSRTGSGPALLARLLGPDEDRDPRLLAAGLAVVALVVILAAFGLGRLFAADGGSGSETDTQARSSGAQGSQQKSPYQGAVHPVPVAAATATCQTGSSVDAAGNPVTYEPAKAHDANLSTAWRCDGSGKGQRLTLTLPRKTVVAQVGLVPGYAKTDPASGVDRYAENNRITKVRWRFDDGSTFVQRMSGNAVNRSMRLRRLPETSTRRVVLEILASTPGTRNTVAISELRIASPQG